MPTVTIITPSYNQAAFLPATLASVSAQSYPFIEHLVRDGGSTDGSQAILAAMVPPPPRRFDWRSERDGGQAAAINQAIQESAGQVIAWVNSDDLLTPGAVERAVAHFKAHPNHLMVYGRARWIDETGAPIDWYPTLPPGPAEHFRDGCFICQPTVFLRREAFAEVGLLDASLFASHDFEFWIRLFKAARTRIGFINAEQAQSRLHAATKTLSGWDRAAIESMAVVHRHFGGAPAHWLLSAATECFNRHPGGADGESRPHALSFLRRALPLLDREEAAVAMRHLRHDRRLRASGPGVAVEIGPDGWAGRGTAIRVRRNGHHSLILHGQHAHPRAAPETLTLRSGMQVLDHLDLTGNGPFAWRIPLPSGVAGGTLECFDLVAQNTFVPAAIEAGSSDCRELSVLIDTARLE
ncbi:glycosyltransferase family 2 protein [Azospirillum sp. sgz301742]